MITSGSGIITLFCLATAFLSGGRTLKWPTLWRDDDMHMINANYIAMLDCYYYQSTELPERLVNLSRRESSLAKNQCLHKSAGGYTVLLTLLK